MNKNVMLAFILTFNLIKQNNCTLLKLLPPNSIYTQINKNKILYEMRERIGIQHHKT